MCAAAAFAVATSGSPVSAQSGLDRLQLHGYLTQGYATSSDLPIFGIPTSGTVEYRTAALQFRYGLSENDAAVIQLKHRKMGMSALTHAEPEVSVDWAFYNRRLGNGSVKIGRVPLAAGLLNETRNVGTITPFYRAPGNFYLEGVDAMDGVTGSYELSAGSWSLETSASVGEVNMQWAGPSETGEITSLAIKLDGFVAGQVWVNTPLHGVRFGGSAQRWDGMDGADDASLVRVSTEAVRNRYFARGEYQEVDLGDMQINMYYAQGGLKLARFGLNGQADFADMQMQTPFGEMRFQSARDLALGVSFAQSANLVYKLEAHRARGTNFDTFINPMGPKGESNYFIGSVSVSF